MKKNIYGTVSTKEEREKALNEPSKIHLDTDDTGFGVSIAGNSLSLTRLIMQVMDQDDGIAILFQEACDKYKQYRQDKMLSKKGKRND